MPVLNGTPVESDELPLIYDSIRRREDDLAILQRKLDVVRRDRWRARPWQRRKTTRSDTLPLCYELGLNSGDDNFTLSGRSLLGLLKRSRQYHA